MCHYTADFYQKRKKSFQIILPSDVDIASASVNCLRATKSVLRRRRRRVNRALLSTASAKGGRQ